MYAYTVATGVPTDPDRWSFGRRAGVAFGVIVAAVLVTVGVFALVARDREHERWRQAVCGEVDTASADRLLADAGHLPWNQARTDAVAYAGDLAKFGPSSLVTQRAFDTLVRACATG